MSRKFVNRLTVSIRRAKKPFYLLDNIKKCTQDQLRFRRGKNIYETKLVVLICDV